MRTLVGLGALEPPAAGSVITIGTFDGVHVGHRALIAMTVQEARRMGAAAVAVTWDRHPSVTLRPDRTPPLLTSPARKVELLESTELDLLAMIPFDRELSQWPPERFVDEVLVEGLGGKAVLVGRDWRFGAKAKGDVGLLARMGEEQGFDVQGIDLQGSGGAAVSSSRIRRAVEEGDMEEARALLARPYDIDGPVIRGDSRGKSLGFPTANVALDPVLAQPPVGVYAGTAQVMDVTRPAAINIGTNPTFGGSGGPRIEAYVLDFEGDLYGQTIRVAFWKRLREEMRFDSAESLVTQMREDVAETRTLITT